MDGKASLKKYNDGEASRLNKYASAAGMQLPGKYASGGAVKSKGKETNITIVVGKDSKPDPMAGLAAAAAMAPKPPPVTMNAPPQPPMPPAGGPGMGGLPGMKRGGAATAKLMTAGAGTGQGREQKAASEAKKERGRKA